MSLYGQAREPDPHGFEDVVIPDDLSSLTEQGGIRLSIVLTQVATAEALAATCALHGIDVVAASSKVGAYAVTQPGDGERVAARVSAAVASVPLLLLQARDGRVAASRWQDGDQSAEVPAALVLSGAPAELEGLLFGTTTVTQVPGTVRSTDISRWKAVRMLATRPKRGDKDS